ncbi:MAG: prepilin peptidase [Candidatus Taylorbacteria bacterium]|nr:prepilin peptidase [Candidatus Taylorbacteria bacterium]
MITASVPIIIFIFGVVIGSFLNVVVLRLNTGLGIQGRSMCMSCGKSLTWRELIPILSFIFQLGKCRNCKSKISWQYPLVELATGLLFVLIYLKFPPISNVALMMIVIYLIITCLLIVITVYDIKHKIIPDPLVYIFDALALATVFLGGPTFIHSPHIWTILAGPILAAPFTLLWLVSKGKWIGFGDAKLVLGLGWLLGLHAGINAVVISFWIGAAVAVIWMLVTYGRFKRGLEIPFGPFLILATYLVLLFGLNVIDLRFAI